MRQLFAVGIMFLLYGLAWGQDDWVPPGAYSQPFVPRIATPAASSEALVTPSLALATPALAVGAGHVTMSNATGSEVHFNQPLRYEPGVQTHSPLNSSAAPAPPEATSATASHEPRRFELGAATFQSSYGVARLMGNGPRRQAVRVYTNPDVARLNDDHGTIKYGGKLAHLN